MVSTKDSTTTIPSTLLELISESSFEGMAQVMQILFNAAMLAERQRYLGVGPYERSTERVSHANGFKAKRVKTRIGELDLLVPQTRDGNFYPGCLQKGSRSETAFRLAVAEMYVQGVSTRKVAHILEEMAGFEIDSATVSRITALLDPELQKWRTRKLGCYPYVFLDARYENVRHGGSIISQSVLVAIAIDSDGKRDILGVSVSISEAEEHWKSFLNSLKKRGLREVRLFISDDHQGLKAARRTIFPRIPWQRCQTHLQRNAASYVPKAGMKSAVAADIRAIFQAQDLKEAERLLKKVCTKYERSAPRLSEWMAENLPQGLTVFSFPAAHRMRIRTTNHLERLNREIKRRTKVVSIFPNEASCLRLVTAVAIEIAEEWQHLPKYSYQALKFPDTKQRNPRRTAV